MLLIEKRKAAEKGRGCETNEMFRLEINIFNYVCHAVYEPQIKINAVEEPEV